MSWEEEERWTFRSPHNTSVEETYHFQNEICKSTKTSLALVPQKMPFLEGSHVCSKLSGNLVEYVDKEKFDEITRFLTGRGPTSTKMCASPWGEEGRNVAAFLGGTDSEDEGIWRTFQERKQILHLPWAPNRPTKNGTSNNCILLAARSKEIGLPMLELDEGETDIIDENCMSSECPVCEMPAAVPSLVLRGLCPQTKFSQDYIFRLTEEGDLEYSGRFTSTISFDQVLNVWILRDSKDPESKATSPALKSSLFLGEQILDFSEVKNDECTTGLKSKKVIVKLTSCSEGQFTCSDGSCIGMRQRCDQLIHCRDASDERDCGLLELGKSYNRKVPPIVTENTTSFSPAKLGISIILMKVVSINEVNHKIQFQFSIEMAWKENRAKFYNLKQDSSLNSLQDDEISSLWLPLFIYDNTDQKESTRLSAREADLQWTTTLTVIKEGNFTRSGLEEADEKEIFQGKENRLVMTQTYTKEFQCLYILQRYPFDTQVCKIEMAVSVMERKTVALRPEEMILKSVTELTQYLMIKWSLEEDVLLNLRPLIFSQRRNWCSHSKKEDGLR